MVSWLVTVLNRDWHLTIPHATCIVRLAAKQNHWGFLVAVRFNCISQILKSIAPKTPMIIRMHIFLNCMERTYTGNKVLPMHDVIKQTETWLSRKTGHTTCAVQRGAKTMHVKKKGGVVYWTELNWTKFYLQAERVHIEADDSLWSVLPKPN